MRPLVRPAGAALLLLAGVLLDAAPAPARVVQAGPSPEVAAESGGRKVPAAGRSRPSCADPVAVGVLCALASPFAFGGWFGWPQAEALARVTAAASLQIEAERAAWRAPRLAARRALIERRRGKLSHPH